MFLGLKLFLQAVFQIYPYNDLARKEKDGQNENRQTQ